MSTTDRYNVSAVLTGAATAVHLYKHTGAHNVGGGGDAAQCCAGFRGKIAHPAARYCPETGRQPCRAGNDGNPRKTGQSRERLADDHRFSEQMFPRVCARRPCVSTRARSFPVTRGPASPSRPFARVQWTRSEVAAPRSNNKRCFIWNYPSRFRRVCRPPHITFSSCRVNPVVARKTSLPPGRRIDFLHSCCVRSGGCPCKCFVRPDDDREQVSKKVAVLWCSRHFSANFKAPLKNLRPKIVKGSSEVHGASLMVYFNYYNYLHNYSL